MAEWYIAGGAVRDLLTGRAVHDVDISFSGGKEFFLSCFPKARKTGSCPEIWMSGGQEFTPLNDIAQDVFRRDFTVNAAAFDEKGRFFSHPDFFVDLEAKILRPASPQAFFKDPLRMFRAARFAALWPDWHLAPETVNGIRNLYASDADKVASLAAERVGREFMYAMSGPVPSRFFSVLLECGGLVPWFSECRAAADIPAGPAPWHDNSVFEHTLEVMDRCAGHPLAVWMALCHDLGKIWTETSVLPHHYGHEARGAEIAKKLGARLKLPSRFIRAGATGALLHMKGGMYGSLRAGTRRDLVVRLHREGIFHDFWLVASADGGVDWESFASRDLAAALSVRLPKEWRSRGEESGRKLRMMQCEAISRLPSPVCCMAGAKKG